MLYRNDMYILLIIVYLTFIIISGGENRDSVSERFRPHRVFDVGSADPLLQLREGHY